jgi:hypothetical protein
MQAIERVVNMSEYAIRCHERHIHLHHALVQCDVRYLFSINSVTKCLKAGIEESFPRQRIETTASITIQLLGESLKATMIVVA